MSTSRNTLPSMQATNPNATSKIGLALSGGGFRATLFHLGVVAAFRQLGRLKEVGVVSCVSGGSIIGAHLDRKSTRLNSSHLGISYAVFCLKKKNRNDCVISHYDHA